jgi:hypothetical protein
MTELYSESVKTPNIQSIAGIQGLSKDGLPSNNNDSNEYKNKKKLPDSQESFAELQDAIPTRYFDPPKTKKTSVPFWLENPNVLFQYEYIFEFFPVETMTYSQKLNAITRSVLLMGIVIFGITQNAHIFIILAITIGSIALVYNNHQKNNKNKSKQSKNVVRFDLENDGELEPFTDKTERLAQDTLKMENIKLMNLDNAGLFDKSTPSNPFSNVLLTDYEHNPTKKTAPTSYNKFVNADILGQAKEFVKQANPDQPDIADKLFKDLGEEFQFEQSMRPFYSNAATTIPNDQQAFTDFCYGSMVSCKEGNMFACSRKYQTMPAV